MIHFVNLSDSLRSQFDGSRVFAFALTARHVWLLYFPMLFAFNSSKGEKRIINCSLCFFFRFCNLQIITRYRTKFSQSAHYRIPNTVRHFNYSVFRNSMEMQTHCAKCCDAWNQKYKMKQASHWIKINLIERKRILFITKMYSIATATSLFGTKLYKYKTVRISSLSKRRDKKSAVIDTLIDWYVRNLINEHFQNKSKIG